jgi:hypothetical protein
MPVEPMPGPKASSVLSTLLRIPVSQKSTKGAAPCQAEAQAAVDLFRHTLRRTARTSDRGCHIVTSAGIAVPVP